MSDKWQTAQVYSQVAEAKRLLEEARMHCPHERIAHTGQSGGHDYTLVYSCVACEGQIFYVEAEVRNFGRAPK